MSDMDYPDPVPLEIPPLVRKEPVTGPPLLPCPECGKDYRGANGLGVHRSTMHGVVGPTGSKKKKKKPQPPRSEPPHPQPLSYLLGAQEEERWSVEEIFDSVVSLLWPKGTMPVAALPILIEWRESTGDMLRRLEDL